MTRSGQILALAGVASALALLAGTPALANPGNGNSQHASHANHGPAVTHVTVVKVKPAKRAKACPPGLAKKHTGCLPPGQWKKGDLLPLEWTAQYIRYGALPDFYRARYAYDSSRRYLYRDGRVFVINAVTHAIVDIVIR